MKGAKIGREIKLHTGASITVNWERKVMIPTEWMEEGNKRFGKIDDLVTQCGNCLCSRCVNNVEELWSKVRPEEQRKPCFNCDECNHYTGDIRHRSQRREDCREFEISDNAAASRRKKIKLLEMIAGQIN